MNNTDENILNENLEEEIEENIEENYSNVRTADFKENVFEWLNGQDIVTVTLSQKRFINKILKLSKEFPEEVRIDRINDDGTILAHIPLKYVRISRPRELSEEEKELARQRLNSYKKKSS